jgi:chitodextrinase
MIASRRAWKFRPILSALALSMVASAACAYPVCQSLWQPLGSSGGGATNPPPSNPSPDSAGCAPAWSAANVYTGGSRASLGSVNYTANYWSQGVDPLLHNGGAGSREPWTLKGRCSGGGATNPLPTKSTSR